jgi:hypothetical protein
MPPVLRSNFDATYGLTKEEEILHHYAGMVRKHLEAFHASWPLSEPRDEPIWRHVLKDCLVAFILVIHCHILILNASRRHQ